mmetsp:Transcript_15949/g.52571  ORF Transcript_15949/g.52571 Transcript_15949/m.52571 type:complete len:362 (+) Transcript_15949:1253-2338(+)
MDEPRGHRRRVLKLERELDVVVLRAGDEALAHRVPVRAHVLHRAGVARERHPLPALLLGRGAQEGAAVVEQQQRRGRRLPVVLPAVGVRLRAVARVVGAGGHPLALGPPDAPHQRVRVSRDEEQRVVRRVDEQRHPVLGHAVAVEAGGAAGDARPRGRAAARRRHVAQRPAVDGAGCVGQLSGVDRQRSDKHRVLADGEGRVEGRARVPSQPLREGLPALRVAPSGAREEHRRHSAHPRQRREDQLLARVEGDQVVDGAGERARPACAAVVRRPHASVVSRVEVGARADEETGRALDDDGGYVVVGGEGTEHRPRLAGVARQHQPAPVSAVGGHPVPAHLARRRASAAGNDGGAGGRHRRD